MKHQLDFEKPVLELQRKLEELKKHPGFEEEGVTLIQKKIEETKRQIFAQLSPWDRIKIARHPKRPFTLDYVASIFTDFNELHGDRLFADDHAMIGGFAKLDDQQRSWSLARKKAATPRSEWIRRNFEFRPSRGLPQGPAPDAAGG